MEDRENVDVSVIIPVYNVRVFLLQCVQSVTCQTWQNIEILLIDDGSTDGSGELCEELAKQDMRIRVLHKPNGGQGSARDLGLDTAKGEYTLFVDSDDEIAPRTVEENLHLARKNDADLVVFGYWKRYVDAQGNSLKQDSADVPPLEGVYSFAEFWRSFPKARYMTVPWVRLYRTSYLNDNHLRFTALRIGEDAWFYNHVCDTPFTRIVYNPKPYCIYNIRPQSTMTSFRGEYFERFYAEKRAFFREVVARHEPHPHAFDDMVTQSDVASALEAIKKLSFAKRVKTLSEREQLLRDFCADAQVKASLAICKRELIPEKWRWFGVRLLQKEQYRAALHFFDFLQTVREKRGMVFRIQSASTAPPSAT